MSNAKEDLMEQVYDAEFVLKALADHKERLSAAVLSARHTYHNIEIGKLLEEGTMKRKMVCRGLLQKHISDYV